MKSSFAYSVRSAAFVLTIAAVLLLCACTSNTGSADENGLLPHLTVDLQLPSALSSDKAGQFRAIVSQGDKPIGVASVIFEIWPDGQPDRRVTLTGTASGEGVYTAEHRLGSEGVYVVRCRAASGSFEAMPAKRIAIGKDAVLRLASLENPSSASEKAAGQDDGHQH